MSKILIIDDERDVIETLSLRLKSMGYDILSATDGEAGLRQATEEKPNLIILDLTLPLISGEEICQTIKSHPNKNISSIPIIILTAKDTYEQKVAGKDMGASSYLYKPFHGDELMQEITRLIK